MFEPTEEQNIENMKRCPRFGFCDIPRCPLDYWMKDRTELKDDKKCILISPRGGRVDGNIRGILKKKLSKYIWEKNRSGNIPLSEGCLWDKGAEEVKVAKNKGKNASL